MASIKKLIQKMKNQPNGIALAEAARVLNAYGYNFIRRRSSHHSYRNNSGDVITIVERSGKPIKRVYVEDVLDRIGEN